MAAGSPAAGQRQAGDRVRIVLVVVPALAAAVLAIATAVACGPVLRRLPEPSGSAEDVATKIPYAELADRRFALGCGLVSFALGWSGWLLLPPRAQAPWLVLASLGVLLALIDARTTWVPLRPTRWAWVAMAVAVILTAVWSADPVVLLRGAVGAVAGAALFALVRRVSGGAFGFGDVRYAALTGAATATCSWTALVLGLLLATMVGGVVGIVQLARGRRDGFPYVPAILLGAYLGLAWSVLSSR